MSARRTYPPKRRLRHEVLALLPLVAVQAAVVAAFPRGAAGFSPDPPRPTAPSCAFVSLSPEAEAAAMDDVRGALSVNAASVRNLRTDLSLATLAEEPPEPLLDEDSRPPAAKPAVCRYDGPPLPPSAAAQEPPQIEDAEPSLSAVGPFPRDALLKADETIFESKGEIQ